MKNFSGDFLTKILNVFIFPIYGLLQSPHLIMPYIIVLIMLGEDSNSEVLIT